MKNKFWIFLIAACICANATPINITSTALGGKLDNQVCAGNQKGNQWDVESVLLDNTKLSLVGSYNFKAGQYDPGTKQTFYSGDIFIDLNNDATNATISGLTDKKYSNFSNSLVKYDYAISLNFSTNKYTIYQLSNTSVLQSAYFGKTNSAGNPFKYVSGAKGIIGTYDLTYNIGLPDNASLGYTSWMPDAKNGLTGTSFGRVTHNQVTVDLAPIGLKNGQKLTSHFTIGCGNDVITGQTCIKLPEPGSFSMIIVGLLSLIGIAVSRKRKN
jgi:hypothetical protein